MNNRDVFVLPALSTLCNLVLHVPSWQLVLVLYFPILHLPAQAFVPSFAGPEFSLDPRHASDSVPKANDKQPIATRTLTKPY